MNEKLREADLTLLKFFIGKRVVVENVDYKVSGKLKAVERLQTERHAPITFIIATKGGVIIMRGWSSVGEKMGKSKNRFHKRSLQSY